MSLGFYIYTLQPSLSWGDGTRLQREVITGESFILAELVEKDFADDPYPFAKLGIAAWDHPLYIVIGHILIRVLTPLGLDPLFLVNLLSAFFGAGTIALVFYLAVLLTNSLVAAGAGAFYLMVSHTFWWHSATPEVYTLHAFLLLLCIVLFMKAWDSGNARYYYGSAFVLGLGASNHLLMALIVPAFIFFLYRNRRLLVDEFLSTRKLILISLSFLAGFGLFIIQLLRMLRTFSPSELIGPLLGSTFIDNLPSITLVKNLGTYVLLLLVQFPVAGLWIGLVGIGIQWREKRLFFSLLMPLFLVYTSFGVLYQVSDQFAFHLTSYVLFAIFISIGAAHLLSGRFAKITIAASLVFILLNPQVYHYLPSILRNFDISETYFGIPVIGSGVRDGLSFYINPNKHGKRDAYRFGSQTLIALPENAMVLAQWYTDTDEYFVFQYFSKVEGLRPDIDIVGFPLEDNFAFDSKLTLDLISEQIHQRPVYLSSLSTKYYAADQIMSAYCVYPENNLYRVQIRRSEQACL